MNIRQYRKHIQDKARIKRSEFKKRNFGEGYSFVPAKRAETIFTKDIITDVKEILNMLPERNLPTKKPIRRKASYSKYVAPLTKSRSYMLRTEPVSEEINLHKALQKNDLPVKFSDS